MLDNSGGRWVLTLGDIVEGNDTPEKTYKDFQDVLIRLEKVFPPTISFVCNRIISISQSWPSMTGL